MISKVHLLLHNFKIVFDIKRRFFFIFGCSLQDESSRFTLLGVKAEGEISHGFGKGGKDRKENTR